MAIQRNPLVVSAVRKAVSAVSKAPIAVHAAAIICARDWLENANPNDIIYLFEQLNPYGGSHRNQALALWCNDFLGLTVEISDKGVKAKKNRAFDWSRDPVEIYNRAKATEYYSYAPAEKPLKTPKLQENAINFVTVARGLLSGDISEEDARDQIDSAWAAITKIARDKKTAEWVEKYQAQAQAH